MTDHVDSAKALLAEGHIICGHVVHAPVLAALHEEAFVAPWSTQAFIDLLSQPTVRVLIWGIDEPAGFVMNRIAANEMEILTLAVRPAHQRRGVAQTLLRAALTDAISEGAVTCYLEVAEDNAAAIALYAGLEFSPSGRRPGYYARPSETVDAILMKKDLNAV